MVGHILILFISVFLILFTFLGKVSLIQEEVGLVTMDTWAVVLAGMSHGTWHSHSCSARWPWAVRFMFMVIGYGSQRSWAHALFQQLLRMKFCMGLLDSGRGHLPFCWTAGGQGSVVKTCMLRHQGLCSGTLSPGDTQKEFQRHTQSLEAQSSWYTGTHTHSDPHQIPCHTHILSQTPIGTLR